jgi:uncharacterized protein YkwD/chitodextrinase
MFVLMALYDLSDEKYRSTMATFVRRFFTVFILILTFVLSAGSAFGATGTPTLDTEEWNFLIQVNNLRVQNGVAPLQISLALENAAHWMSSDMATNNYYGAIDSLGRTIGARLGTFGYTYGFWTEDRAKGSSDAASIFNQWLAACDPNSLGLCTYAHQLTMLSASNRVIGIGRGYNAQSAYGWYWDVEFGAYVDQTLNATPPPPSIASFTASSPSITAGQSTTLLWTVSGASTVNIDNGVGDVSNTTFKSVTPAQTTTYTLTATNSGGTATTKVTVTVGGISGSQPPTTPSLISAVGKSATEVDLAWSASTGNVVGYQITRNGSVLTSVAGGTLAYADTTVSASATYTYLIRAYNAAASYSAASNSIQVTTPAVTVSAPVISSFSATPSTISAGQSAALSWSVSGATGITLDNGIGDVSGVTSKSVSPAQSTTYNLTATNSGGSVSAHVTVTVNAPQPPTTPTLVAAAAKSATEVDLSWTASSSSTGVAGYQISRNGSVLTSAPGSTLSYSDNGVSASSAYTYFVKAYDAAGNYSAASNTIQVTTPAATPAPVISFFNATPPVITGGQSTTLAWNVSGATSIMLDNGIGNVSNFTSDSVVPVQTTTYTLTATNSGGSVVARVTVTVNASGSQSPTTPVLISAIAKSATEVDLAWSASSSGNAVAGYQITRSGSVATTVAGSVLSYADTSASPNTSYTYFVRAYDTAGNYSNASNSIAITTPQSSSTTICPGPITGAFSGCYFNNITLSGTPTFVRTDNLISFNWGNSAPDTSLTANNFSVRWQGLFSFNQGNYTFSVITSDGMRVYVDGNVAFDHWRDQTPTMFTFSQTLSQGNHLIVVEYYEHTSAATAALSWQKN